MRDVIVIRKMCIETYANTLLHHDYMFHKIITWDDLQFNEQHMTL